MKMSVVVVVVVVVADDPDASNGTIIGPVARPLTAALDMTQCSAYGSRSRKVIVRRPSVGGADDDDDDDDDDAYANPATPSPHPSSTTCDEVRIARVARAINDDDDDDDDAPPSSSSPSPKSSSSPRFSARRTHRDSDSAVGHTRPQLGSASVRRMV